MLALFIEAHGVPLGLSIFQQLGINEVPIELMASKFSLHGSDRGPQPVVNVEDPTQLLKLPIPQLDLTQK